MSENARPEWLLKFISGKYQGGEFPLLEGEEYIVGRAADTQLVLVEDMVSRQHAKLYVEGGLVKLLDLNSTNGSFVNGERVNQCVLKEGDRILFGTSIIKLMRASSTSGPYPTAPEHSTPTSAIAAAATSLGAASVPGAAAATGGATMAIPAFNPAQFAPSSLPLAGPGSVGKASVSSSAATASGAVGGINPVVSNPSSPGVSSHPSSPSAAAVGSGPGAGRRAGTSAGAMSGLLEEVALPDLLQLLSASRKTGVLRVMQETRDAAMYLREGRLVFVEISDAPELHPEKAAYRVMTWTTGEFVLEPGTERTFETELEYGTESLMMEAMRLSDELENIRHRLPPMDATLSIKRPLVPPLRSLTPELLDTLQLVVNWVHVETILNHSLASDLETLQDIDYLAKHGYIEVTPGS